MMRLFKPKPTDALSHRDFVRAAYLGVLQREPDAEGWQAYCDQLSGGMPPQDMLISLMASAERSDRIRWETEHNPIYMENATPNPVEIDVDDGARVALWQRIAASWQGLGDQDPYWSVVTDPRWRQENMSDADALDAFYETGWPDLHRLDAWFGRNGQAVPGDGICAEYGCGVGRVTRLLARRFKTVRAFDISAPHLRAAEARLSAEGIRNVEYVLLREPGDLSALQGCDLFFSFIVLQHNPPPVISRILDQAMAGLNPGGMAFFQVPIWSSSYQFRVAPYLASGPIAMEMHCLPQRAVLAIARRHGCEAVEIQPDGCAGPEFVSNTFLLAKRS